MCFHVLPSLVPKGNATQWIFTQEHPPKIIWVYWIKEQLTSILSGGGSIRGRLPCLDPALPVNVLAACLGPMLDRHVRWKSPSSQCFWPDTVCLKLLFSWRANKKMMMNHRIILGYPICREAHGLALFFNLPQHFSACMLGSVLPGKIFILQAVPTSLTLWMDLSRVTYLPWSLHQAEDEITQPLSTGPLFQAGIVALRILGLFGLFFL